MLANAIVGHMVGDYILQFDWMAKGKKENSAICACHCILWTLSVMLFTWVWNLEFFAFLFITHFIQDRTKLVHWMMGFAQKGFREPPFAPWSMIVYDNTLHLVQLYIAVRWLT